MLAIQTVADPVISGCAVAHRAYSLARNHVAARVVVLELQGGDFEDTGTSLLAGWSTGMHPMRRTGGPLSGVAVVSSSTGGVRSDDFISRHTIPERVLRQIAHQGWIDPFIPLDTIASSPSLWMAIPSDDTMAPPTTSRCVFMSSGLV